MRKKLLIVTLVLQFAFASVIMCFSLKSHRDFDKNAKEFTVELDRFTIYENMAQINFLKHGYDYENKYLHISTDSFGKTWLTYCSDKPEDKYYIDLKNFKESANSFGSVSYNYTEKEFTSVFLYGEYIKKYSTGKYHVCYDDFLYPEDYDENTEAWVIDRATATIRVYNGKFEVTGVYINGTAVEDIK